MELKKPLSSAPQSCKRFIFAFNNSGCGAVGSVLDWGSRGRKFKSCHSDLEIKALQIFYL